MNSKPFLSLEDARRIAAAAEAEARRHGWAVAIAVVDDGGHLIWLQRLDGAAPVAAQIAPAKARTAALGRRESRVYEAMINGPRAACSKVACQSSSTGTASARWASVE